MVKRILSLLLVCCAAACLCLPAHAQGLPFQQIDAPQNVSFRLSYPNEGSECIEAFFTVPDALSRVVSCSPELQEKYYGSTFVGCVQYDWAIDDAKAFHYDASWDTTEGTYPVQPLTGSFYEQSEVFWFVYDADAQRCAPAVKTMQSAGSDGAAARVFDFDAHKLFVRARFFVYDTQAGSCTFSDWTDALDVQKNRVESNPKLKKCTDAPQLSRAEVVDEGVYSIDFSFTKALQEMALALKSGYGTELNLESQVRFNGGEWRYWIIENELFPYRVGVRQLTVSGEDAQGTVEYRCRLTGGNPDNGTDVTTAWSDIFVAQDGKARLETNDDPFDEKAAQAQKAAELKEKNRCKLCGRCPVHPFGICMFIWLGILLFVVLVVLYLLRNRRKKKARDAEIEARRRASAESGDSDKTKSFVQTDRIALQNEEERKEDENHES